MSFQLPRFLKVRTNRRVRGATATIVLIHGIGNTGDSWQDVIKVLPKTVNVISIDLLGFGHSPKPKINYNVRIQAQSVFLTLLKLRVRRPIILIGHSMGSLVSIELARYFPLPIKGLILCAPPLYRNKKEITSRLAPEKVLTATYKKLVQDAKKHPTRYTKLADSISGTKLASTEFTVDDQILPAYLDSIINGVIPQTSLTDIKKIKQPIKIIYGALDPLVVPANIQRLARQCHHITADKVLASHEVTKAYHEKIVTALDKMVMN